MNIDTINKTKTQLANNGNRWLYGAISQARSDGSIYLEHWNDQLFLVTRVDGRKAEHLSATELVDHLNEGREIYDSDYDSAWHHNRPTWDREGYEKIGLDALECLDIDLINKVNNGTAMFVVRDKVMGIRHKAGKERLWTPIVFNLPKSMGHINNAFYGLSLEWSVYFLLRLDLISHKTFSHFQREMDRGGILMQRERKIQEIMDNVAKQEAETTEKLFAPNLAVASV